ncbi:alkaline phosphatase-like protein [Apiospora arundinis]|uniref:GPI ethanolamine phosphate transferase 2 n=1 Tax=Apiospora arundinis TaxID=335852 RepID=A0ABR2HM18_9PEZI
MRRSQYGSYLSTALLVAANLLIPVAIYIFAKGFFPYKPLLPGLAQYHEAPQDGRQPAPPFDRLVFMVVDALRSDFVYTDGTGFQFTQSLIKDGAAMPFTAHATSPTVTMPRLKAITTGSIPSFLDVILNLDEADTSSQLSAQDSWLAQMKAKKTGKLLLYGDDTWLKLFPDTFDRADGTSSFFVSDFTEVDNNVTRHITSELRQDDWNTMVLHYLGLDHIGHKSGPRSVNMVPKQHEMDGIVREIYGALETQPHLQSTLLVLIGDHGMNDAGNHGASSAGETSSALVFMSPKLKSIAKPAAVPAPFDEDFQYYTKVDQSDLAPTLGALLGFPVPKNNLGAFIQDFLPFWSNRHDQMHLLLSNAKQIFDIIAAASGVSLTTDYASSTCRDLSTVAEELACELQSISQSVNTDSSDDQEKRLSMWLQRAQELMSSMASNYDMSKLVQGGASAVLALTLAIASLIMVGDARWNLLPFAAITILYGIMMFASSYVEEEHHFWYWSASAWLFYVTLSRATRQKRTPAITAVAALVVMRLIRGWNQTGQKFAGEPDIVKIFMTSNPQLLWCLSILTYLITAVKLRNRLDGLPRAISVPLVTVLITTALSFKVAFCNEDSPELIVGFMKTVLSYLGEASLVGRAQAVFAMLALGSVYPVYSLLTQPYGKSRLQDMKTLHHLYTVLALTQSRVTNLPLFLLFQILQLFLERLAAPRLETAEISTTSLVLQLASFFAMGGTNAISSVDLSNAYNGISGYNVVAVGILTFVSNFAGPVWWASATNVLLLQRKLAAATATATTTPTNGAAEISATGGTMTKDSGEEGESKSSSSSSSSESVWHQHIALWTVFVTASLGFVMAACTALRTHLFIWTVFSPKYLYSMAWSLGQHLLVNVGLGGLLYWLGTR